MSLIASHDVLRTEPYITNPEPYNVLRTEPYMTCSELSPTLHDVLRTEPYITNPKPNNSKSIVM